MVPINISKYHHLVEPKFVKQLSAPNKFGIYYNQIESNNLQFKVKSRMEFCEDKPTKEDLFEMLRKKGFEASSANRISSKMIELVEEAFCDQEPSMNRMNMEDIVDVFNQIF